MRGRKAPIGSSSNNNKCLASIRTCVSCVIISFIWLSIPPASCNPYPYPRQWQDKDDRLQELLATTTTTTTTTMTPFNSSQTNSTEGAANRAKSSLGLAELNPDASDTVPVYMQHMTIILCTLHLSVFVTGLVGNSLVCLSVYRNKSLQTITNYYIVNLAVADFLVILICLPPTVIWDLTLTWNFGLVLCKLVLYLQSISVSVSVLTLTCISIDRWYAICRPLKFSSSKSRAKLTIALIWLVSLLIASPDVIFLTTSKLYEDEEEDKVYMDCTYSWPEENTRRYQLCIVTLLFILPFVFMIISYSQIVNVLWRNETMAESMQNSFQLEDEAATAAAASTANGGGGGGGGKMVKGRAAKNESVISTTSMVAIAGASVGQNNNGGARHRWRRCRRRAPPKEVAVVARAANQCDDWLEARTDGLCASCAAASAASRRLESVTPSNSSNASNASYLVTPSGSLTMRFRSFAILKLCQRGCRGREPKQRPTAAPKINSTCSPADDAAAAAAATTTGRLVAANILSHQGGGGGGSSNNSLAVCQFERCGDLKCLNSGVGDGHGENVGKLNVNNSPATAACLMGTFCSEQTKATESGENMEISAGWLVDRGPPFALDGGDNNSVYSSNGPVITAKTIRDHDDDDDDDDDDDKLLKQYDNEQKSLLPTTASTTDGTGAKIARTNYGARRWTLSAVLSSSCNNSTSDLGGANYCEHASGPASVSPSPRAECLTRGENKSCACDRKVKAAGDAITKSCKLHAAADGAQCCTPPAAAADNHDDHHNKINRRHGCRQRPRRRRHRHRRATCHELNEPTRPTSASSAAEIIITEIRESGRIILADANHRRLDVETNELRDPNGTNSNYYTRERRAAKPVDKHEAKQGAGRDSMSESSLAHNPQKPNVRPAVPAREMSARSQAVSEMPTRQYSAPITMGSSSQAGTNKLSEALRPTDGHGNAAMEFRRENVRSGHKSECLLDEDDKNDDDDDDDDDVDGGRRHQHEAAPESRRKSNKPSASRLHRHYQRQQQQHHHHHHCKQKHTDESHCGSRHRRVPRVECTPTSDHVLSSKIVRNNISDPVASASSLPEIRGQDATSRASSELSAAGSDGRPRRRRRQVVVLTSRTGNGSNRRPLEGAKGVIRVPPALATLEFEAKTNELDIGTNGDYQHPHPLDAPLQTLKWPVVGDHLTSIGGRRCLGSKLKWTGNDSSAGSTGEQEQRDPAQVIMDDAGDEDIRVQRTRELATKLQKSMEQGDSGRCSAVGSLQAQAARKSVTYETKSACESPQESSSWSKGHGWCLGCCADTNKGLWSSPLLAAGGPPRVDHHYRQEPLNKLATSLSKQQQQQQQHGHGKAVAEANGFPAISCDNRQSNGRLSVILAPAPAPANSLRQATKTKPAAGPLSPGLSSCEALCRGSSLQSINQAAQCSERRGVVKCMAATKFPCIKRFVRLMPSAGVVVAPHSSPSGSPSGNGGRNGTGKCRVCHKNLAPAASETKGFVSSDPPTTVGASESHAHQQQQQPGARAPARSSSARSASGGAQANGAAACQHAQIHNRSSAPLQSSFGTVGAQSCSLVVKTITPSQQQQQQQQQHNHYPNHSQQQPHYAQPNHSSTRFYKLIESRKKAAKMLIVIVIMFGLCYLPIHFLNTLRYTTGLPQNDITTIASLVSHWLCYFNSAVNPLIYNFMSGKFRHEFANLFFCRFLRRT